MTLTLRLKLSELGFINVRGLDDGTWWRPHKIGSDIRPEQINCVGLVQGLILIVTSEGDMLLGCRSHRMMTLQHLINTTGIVYQAPADESSFSKLVNPDRLRPKQLLLRLSDPTWQPNPDRDAVILGL